MSILIAAKGVYDKLNNDETFYSNKKLDKSMQKFSDSLTVSPIVQIFNVIVLVFALYISFKCNKGFNFGSFLFACCCPILYVPYRLAVPC
jgi:hypothetical protein